MFTSMISYLPTFCRQCPDSNVKTKKSILNLLDTYLNVVIVFCSYSINNMSWKQIPPSSSKYPQPSSGLKPKEQPPKIYVDMQNDRFAEKCKLPKLYKKFYRIILWVAMFLFVRFTFNSENNRLHGLMLY